MVRQDSHENLTTKDEVKSGSDKSFGLVFGVVFAVIGLWPLLNVQPMRFWALVVSVLLVLLSYALPQILAPFNRLWFLFGRLLHKIVNPIIMGLIFYTTVTPTGLILRLLGKRPIPVKFDPDVESYWIKREPPGPTPESMSQQF
jgi:predicted membrane metal-binding protein